MVTDEWFWSVLPGWSVSARSPRLGYHVHASMVSRVRPFWGCADWGRSSMVFESAHLPLYPCQQSLLDRTSKSRKGAILVFDLRGGSSIGCEVLMRSLKITAPHEILSRGAGRHGNSFSCFFVFLLLPGLLLPFPSCIVCWSHPRCR